MAGVSDYSSEEGILADVATGPGRSYERLATGVESFVYIEPRMKPALEQMNSLARNVPKLVFLRESKALVNATSGRGI